MDKLLGYATIYIVVFLTLCALAWATGNVSEDLYTRCPSGLISNGQQMRVVTGRSRVDCAVRCSLTAGCVGVNVCPVEHDGRVSCALLSNIDPSGCDNLDVDSSGECVFMHSGTTDMETTTTAPLVCQNGGSPAFASNDHCLCPIQYSGTTCERLIRDCGELYDKGYDGAAFSGMYDIQPNGALYPFKVPCQFDSATGVTVVFRRTTTSTSLFNQDWATMKAGINLPISSVDDEFFIGLENLHQFLLQGDYQLNVFINYLGTQGNAFYDNVTVGNESTSYELSYDNFHSEFLNSADNGFPLTSGPLKFYTSDTDYMCIFSAGGSGWFEYGCFSTGRIFSNTMQWPVSGTTHQLDLVEMKLSRSTPV